ncbi:photosystem I reaction center subunit XI, chloroplastic-like [Iris pallida]|uniref:Photosystem I reaction center subunit XI, chloroplastic-like n=1 Tax=Iris pallida TaxID=29817 RepID=A0AAX6GS73_IRIPA|nr:photosystem I reaction center subunit XI, chloroplastic-like [Iris pallida]
MASLKSSLFSSLTRGLAVPRGISGGAALKDLNSRRRTNLTVRAIQAEKATNIPSGAAHQRGPLHRLPRDSRHLLAPHRLVPLQPPRLPHRRQPPPPWHRGRPCPRLPPRRPLRQGRTPPQHPHRRRRRLARGGRPRGHPQHLLDDVRHRVVQGRRAVHGALADADRTEEGGRQAADG